MFPYLLCAAAREGNVDALERLQQAVCCSAVDVSSVCHGCRIVVSISNISVSRQSEGIF